MGKVNKLHHVVALTREMTVEYLKPVPLHKPLRVEGREIEKRGRTHINAAGREMRGQKCGDRRDVPRFSTVTDLPGFP
jgi:acyl-coenzyme A thioesterase PaaI-like protein